MRKSLVIAIAALAVAAFAQEAPEKPPAGKKAKREFTPEQLAARDQRVLEKTGGFIDIPASGPAIEIVDARAKPGSGPAWVAEVWTKYAKSPFNVQTNTVPEGKCPYAFGREKLVADKALMVILLAQAGDKMPALSIFPEERVSVVNTDVLAKDTNAIDAELRVIKECWRSIGFIAGVGFVQQDNDVMQPVFSLADLDADEYQMIQPMNYGRMKKMMEKFNVSRARRVAYRAAVKQGWAPAPTNDIQKAVWESVKAETASNAVGGKAVSPAR
jgi:hypothetical protein